MVIPCFSPFSIIAEALSVFIFLFYVLSLHTKSVEELFQIVQCVMLRRLQTHGMRGRSELWTGIIRLWMWTAVPRWLS